MIDWYCSEFVAGNAWLWFISGSRGVKTLEINSQFKEDGQLNIWHLGRQPNIWHLEHGILSP
jgi:hypothetical protein